MNSQVIKNNKVCYKINSGVSNQPQKSILPCPLSCPHFSPTNRVRTELFISRLPPGIYEPQNPNTLDGIDCTFFGIGKCEFHSFNINWVRFLHRFLLSFWKLFRALNFWNFGTVIFIFMGRKASFRKYLVIKN